ncbi:saposin-like type b, region 1 domain-containing protein [Ditylenchus destructor]|uniref:Saposin-like type b, region 1 domain-containing protein n=1 Tax=Ditylenchus destructor TaxID=166010 RepID=A0AAD4MJU6_9BILA|nr:saposin-like type b, region 1 domain-containing protein [Ditylenchus destructor]
MKISYAILLASLSLFVAVSAERDAVGHLLKWYSTPKKNAVMFSSACTECQSIVKRIGDIIQDPTKIEELKMLLQLLCKETSYKDECLLFVDNIDKFLEKLLPHLHDPRAICHKLHICGDKKLEQFRRVGMFYASEYDSLVDGTRDVVCEECQFAARELRQLVEDPRTQAEVKHFLSVNVCAELGEYRGACDMLLDSFMPDFWAEIENVLRNPKQFCETLKLCYSPKDGEQKFFARKISKYLVYQVLKQ